ncbi:pheromone-regulated protein prm10 [Coemansia sp. RSA 1200]|nr:pheromone-regulated protein prm10 [Coemansia sp. RSA 1200]
MPADGGASSRSNKSASPPPLPGGQQQAQSARSDELSAGPLSANNSSSTTTTTTNTSGSPDNGLEFTRLGTTTTNNNQPRGGDLIDSESASELELSQAGIQIIPERRALSLAPEDAAKATPKAEPERGGGPSSPPHVDKPKRPVLRLAMLSTQEQDRLRRQHGGSSNEAATAPVRGIPIELPESGYFAPRDGISRSNTTTPINAQSAQQYKQPVPAPIPAAGNRKGGKKGGGGGFPALRFASRDSVHTIQPGTYSDSSASEDEKAEGDRRHPGPRSSRLYTPIDKPMAQRQRATGGSVDAAFGLPSPRPKALESEAPPGLRRRVTRARTNLQQLGRVLDTATGGRASDSESDSDANTSHSEDTEEKMERVLDRHANSAENPPASNIAANNAEITNTPDFYPVNPAAQNPGVIHVNMSGHAAARNIVEAALGGIGSSTAQHKRQQQLKTKGSSTTPADLEAGRGEKRAHPTFGDSFHPVASGYAGALPGGIGTSPLPSPAMGLGRTPTTLRGVYANLTKLQSRMAEHQEMRDRRAREVKAKEVKRKREEEAKRKRDEEAKRRREDEARQRRDDPRSIVGARIRDMHDRIPGKLAEIRERARSHHPHSHHQHSQSQSQIQSQIQNQNQNQNQSQSESDIHNTHPSASTVAGSSDESFVLRKFQTAPRPESVAMYLSGMADDGSTFAEQQQHRPRPTRAVASAIGSRSQPATPLLSPRGSPPPAATSTPPIAHQSPATTPGWDEILASSGMLTGGALTPGAPGSRFSTASSSSSDATLVAFEAEKQRILAQLADIFNRQNFLLVASRALMAFGAPLHRLEANLIAIALNLDVEATFAALPGIILITFGDEDTRSSETYVVRVASGYDMHRLGRTNRVIRRVLKSRISVGQGVRNLERILATPPIYPWWFMIIDYVLCSFFICPLFWKGSWKDAGVSAMVGLIVGLLQLLAGRFANYANLFEISSAFIVSFVAALLQDYICFGPVSFSGIVMLLPGLALTTSIIEMASRNMISGTVRLVFAMSRCFFLGYGISVGSTLGTQVLGRTPTADLIDSQLDYKEMGNCIDGLSKFWWFLFLPAVALLFNISISAHWRQWPMMIFSGCLAYTVSYFAGLSTALAPLAPAIAAFAMGLFGNILASFSNHRSAVEPILGGVQLLVPGSLGLKTVLTFITNSGTTSGSFLYNIFSTSLSIAAGLFLSGMVVFPNRKKRVGLMTF